MTTDSDWLKFAKTEGSDPGYHLYCGICNALGSSSYALFSTKNCVIQLTPASYDLIQAWAWRQRRADGPLLTLLDCPLRKGPEDAILVLRPIVPET
jgi:hypothetical protein